MNNESTMTATVGAKTNPELALAPSAEKVSRHSPLYLRVLAGVIMGVIFGIIFGEREILAGLKNEHLGQLGMLVIRLLKTLAVPLVLFAILDAFARTRISARKGGKLLLICLMNVSVAFIIGLTLMNTLRPGSLWQDKIQHLTSSQKASAPAVNGTLPGAKEAQPTLGILENIEGYVPKSVVEPFLKNNLITVVLAGVLMGAALRRVKDRQVSLGHTNVQALQQAIEAIYQTLVQVLTWIVQAIPFAVFGVVAQAVGRSGVGLFNTLWVFLAVILLGLVLQSLIYYPLLAWWAGGKSPRIFFGQGADAILTGLSTNSSLATIPVTLHCLTQKMGVSEESARLSACVGTNLNNDGITLYEAMAALFLAQACGMDLSLGQQVGVIFASLMAGIGVAGVPEAGLVVLPLVLGAAGLPDWLVAAAIPLVLPVDWIIARARSAVNVASDMVVAILLDRNTTQSPRNSLGRETAAQE